VDELAAQFEQHRPHLRGVAYRMLGTHSEADDAVQEAWLRLSRTDADQIQNLRGWLTTVVSRICLDMLRSRTARREDPLDVHVPDPIVTLGPEQEAELADSVGLALLVVLDTLAPAERLAFVLHDIFGVPFDEIGPILDRTPGAAKQLASRARGRLRGASVHGEVSAARQREILDAFLAASGAGPLGPSQLLRGARTVAGQALRFAALAEYARPVLVNGMPGFVAVVDGQVVSLLSVTVVGDRIVEMNILADPERLARIDAGALGIA
jgi:RNA polymerase sigma factor (sigma-70 family)